MFQFLSSAQLLSHDYNFNVIEVDFFKIIYNNYKKNKFLNIKNNIKKINFF